MTELRAFIGLLFLRGFCGLANHDMDYFLTVTETPLLVKQCLGFHSNCYYRTLASFKLGAFFAKIVNG